MSRPIINISPTTIDKALETIALISFLLLLVIPIYYFNQLPDEIPTHYNAQGEADAFGSKYMIWFTPAMGTLIYFLLTWLNKYPHKFNYPQKVTDQNAQGLYESATKMMRWLKTVILIGLAYLAYANVQNAMGKMDGIGKLFLPIFLVGTFVKVIAALLRST